MIEADTAFYEDLLQKLMPDVFAKVLFCVGYSSVSVVCCVLVCVCVCVCVCVLCASRVENSVRDVQIYLKTDHFHDQWR